MCIRDSHQLVPGEGLLDGAVQVARLGPLGDELPLAALADQRGGEHGQRDRDQRDERQQRRDQHHHHQDADDGDQAVEQLAERLLSLIHI